MPHIQRQERPASRRKRPRSPAGTGANLARELSFGLQLGRSWGVRRRVCSGWLAIHSPNGELVRLLVNETQEAEVHEAVWDGRDDAGRELATGIYLARFEAGPFSASRKLVLLK